MGRKNSCFALHAYASLLGVQHCNAHVFRFGQKSLKRELLALATGHPLMLTVGGSTPDILFPLHVALNQCHVGLQVIVVDTLANVSSSRSAFVLGDAETGFVAVPLIIGVLEGHCVLARGNQAAMRDAPSTRADICATLEICGAGMGRPSNRAFHKERRARLETGGSGVSRNPSLGEDIQIGHRRVRIDALRLKLKLTNVSGENRGNVRLNLPSPAQVSETGGAGIARIPNHCGEQRPESAGAPPVAHHESTVLPVTVRAIEQALEQRMDGDSELRSHGGGNRLIFSSLPSWRCVGDKSITWRWF
jgi:hypothetical protein